MSNRRHTENAIQFLSEHKEMVNKLNTDIGDCRKRIDELKIEIENINLEMVSAIEKRVLEKDNSYEQKLKKTLKKLEAELQEKEEELPVLERLLPKYLDKSADKVNKLQSLFQAERKEVEETSYGNMMKAKAAYVNAIQKESEVLRKMKQVDVGLQEVHVAAGKSNSIWTNLEVKTAPRLSDKYRFNGVYLQLDINEVKGLVTGNMKQDALEYLDKFK